MIMHTIISELDIFYLPASYMNPQYEQANRDNAIPCITNPAELLKPVQNPYYNNPR
ncbi:MAG: hypothetical protein FWD48_08250 [Oscillospiraceae bacterium]|nr:hypothetical protein [Oscillospiraceae bacterium]